MWSMDRASRSDDRTFPAGVVREAAGLSSRQLNDWAQRGALPEDDRHGDGWRRFSPREVFFLAVAAELRRRFGVSVEKIATLRDKMLGEDVNDLERATELMARLGVSVWLITDLEDTFLVEHELEILDLVESGFLRGDRDRGFIFLKLNPIVNRLLGCLKEPTRIRAHGRGYEILREVRQKFGARTPEEFEVLQLVRSGEYDSVEIAMKDGEVRTIRTGRHVAQPDQHDLTELLRQHDYQTIKVTTRDGRVVSIEQNVPKKRGESRT
jgi:DNA-binding transcriptional MerR regulator